ncbi:hypothetical protein [Eubacterium sp. 1001713B170207_170306_E7]|uniref:hypothetical protein n=1 Tax=Eubacterium sp. 1001713B170207_170306_E7 TaxID=2787097 RepID=UPI00189AFE3D|nr:hypothetical protein [Eubacterium sp. 1001713B170207_170306_E7]
MFNKNTKDTKAEPVERPEVVRIPRGNYILSVEVGPETFEKKLVINSSIIVEHIPGDNGITVELGVSRPGDSPAEVKEHGNC